jgi:hypothetical protein
VSEYGGSVRGHAFLSYVHEDGEAVDRLQGVLEAAGLPVWRDSRDLWPGTDWRLEIRKAITSGSLAFVACFSENSNRREKSYQNEELILAAEQMRLRTPGATWLLPVRLTDCDIPPFDLGVGRTLWSLQEIDLFADRWEHGTARLVAAIYRILSIREDAARPPAAPPALRASARGRRRWEPLAGDSGTSAGQGRERRQRWPDECSPPDAR